MRSNDSSVTAKESELDSSPPSEGVEADDGGDSVTRFSIGTDHFYHMRRTLSRLKMQLESSDAAE
jgi:hypothetical protein